MDKALSTLLARWRELNAREQLFLSLGGAFLLVLLVYFLIFSPALHFYQESRIRFQQARELEHWLDQNRVALQRSAAGRVVTLDTQKSQQSLVAIVSETASAVSIRIDRIEPGANNVRVWADGVEFSALLQWLTELRSGSAILVQEAVLESAGDGRVGMRLQLANASN